MAPPPRDLIAFYQAVLTQRVLSLATTKLLCDRLYPMSPGALYWGRGLMLLKSPLGEAYYSAGRIHGFGANVLYLPAKKAYVAVMVNDDTQTDPVWFALLRAL